MQMTVDNYIQRAEIEDLKEILELQKNAFKPVSLLLNNPNIQPMVQTYEELLEEYNDYLILKYTIDDKIVGSIRGRLTEENRYYIGKLIVHTDHQNKGIGYSLMKKIEEYCITCEKYFLFTGAITPHTLRMYTRLGYTETSREEIDGIDLIMMEKANTNLPAYRTE